jgi:N-acetylneuraminic acid mutarotase
MPTPKANFAIAAYEGKIYCIGGESREGVYSDVEVYDVTTNSWSVKKDIPFDGLGIQAHVADGKIFVIRKQDFSWETGYSSFASDLYLYNLSTDEWTQKDIPYTDWIATGSALVNSVSVTMGDKIMFYFRYIEPGNLWYDIFDKAMIYDPKTNTWSEAFTPPNTLGFPATTLGQVFGGCMTSGIYAPKNIYFFQEKRTTVYDPVQTTWNDVASMPENRIDFGVAVVNDIMYVIGGKDPEEHNDFLAINEQYIPKDYTGTIPPITSPTTTPTPNSNSTSNSNSLIIAIVIIVVVVVVTVVTTSILITKKKQK